MTLERARGQDKPSDSTASLTLNGRKARYGAAYVRAVCAQAGVLMSEGSMDEDVLAFDCTVGFPDGEVRVQVKCSSQASLTASRIIWRLDDSWKRKWARSKNPVYLVVVLVPPNSDDWLEHPAEGTMHRSAAYWTRIRVDELGSQIVVPTSARFTADAMTLWLQDLLDSYSPGVGA